MPVARGIRLVRSNSVNVIDYPPRNRPENCSNYPFLEFTELHRLPPVEIGRKTPPTTPLEFTELHRLPPSKSVGKLLQLPPLEFTELHRLPPVEIGRKTPPTTPSNLRNFIDYPLRNRPEPPFSNPGYGPELSA